MTVDGAAALKDHINGFLTALPDIKFTIEDLIAEGDVAVCRFDSIATHTGTLMNIPATGKKARVSGMLQFRYADGKIAEVWAMYDCSACSARLASFPTRAEGKGLRPPRLGRAAFAARGY